MDYIEVRNEDALPAAGSIVVRRDPEARLGDTTWIVFRQGGGSSRDDIMPLGPFWRAEYARLFAAVMCGKKIDHPQDGNAKTGPRRIEFRDAARRGHRGHPSLSRVSHVHDESRTVPLTKSAG